MKKLIYVLILTVALAALVFGLCQKLDHKGLEIWLFVIFVMGSTIIYVLAIIFGIIMISENEDATKPSSLKCHGSRIILIKKVFRKKIEIVPYDCGIQTEEFEPEYIHLEEIPKELRVKGFVLSVKEKEEYNDDGELFDFEQVEVK